MVILKILARAIIEELRSEGRRIVPSDVAARALLGYRSMPDKASDRAAVYRQIEEYVAEILREDTPGP